MHSNSTQGIKFDIGDIMNRSWETFQSQMGLAIGGYFLASLLMGIGYVLFLMVVPFAVVMIAMAIAGPPGGGGGQADPMFILLIQGGYLTAFFLFAIWNLVLSAGLLKFYLGIARGQGGDLGHLFSGFRHIPTICLGLFLIGTMQFIGTILLIVPGIIIGLMFTKFLWVVVDKNVGALEAMKISRNLMVGNKANYFVFLLVAMGISLAGMVTCGIGLFFAYPYILLCLATIYDTISGGFGPTLGFKEPAK